MAGGAAEVRELTATPFEPSAIASSTLACVDERQQGWALKERKKRRRSGDDQFNTKSSPHQPGLQSYKLILQSHLAPVQRLE